MIGTPYYMAPEQVRGEDLDARADIYSLGATLYRVLTGEPPFDAPSPMSVLSKHLTDDVVPPRSRAPGRSLPPDADRIVLRAMAKSAEDRYASAAEVQQDLERALASPGGEPTSVATVALRRPQRWRARRARRRRCARSVAARATANAAAATVARRRDAPGPDARREHDSDAAVTSDDGELDRLRRSRRRRLRMVAAPAAAAAAPGASR